MMEHSIVSVAHRRRFQEATGEKAVLANTGETIEDAHWRRAIEEDQE